MFLTLTKSKKAILFHLPNGQKFITSVKFMQMLCEGRARGDMIITTELSKAKDGGISRVERKDTGGVDYGGL